MRITKTILSANVTSGFPVDLAVEVFNDGFLIRPCNIILPADIHFSSDISHYNS